MFRSDTSGTGRKCAGVNPYSTMIPEVRKTGRTLKSLALVAMAVALAGHVAAADGLRLLPGTPIYLANGAALQSGGRCRICSAT